jgi:hypothetical protein
MSLNANMTAEAADTVQKMREVGSLLLRLGADLLAHHPGRARANDALLHDWE